MGLSESSNLKLWNILKELEEELRQCSDPEVQAHFRPFIQRGYSFLSGYISSLSTASAPPASNNIEASQGRSNCSADSDSTHQAEDIPQNIIYAPSPRKLQTNLLCSLDGEELSPPALSRSGTADSLSRDSSPRDSNHDISTPRTPLSVCVDLAAESPQSLPAKGRKPVKRKQKERKDVPWTDRDWFQEYDLGGKKLPAQSSAKLAKMTAGWRCSTQEYEKIKSRARFLIKDPNLFGPLKTLKFDSAVEIATCLMQIDETSKETDLKSLRDRVTCQVIHLASIAAGMVGMANKPVYRPRDKRSKMTPSKIQTEGLRLLVKGVFPVWSTKTISSDATEEKCRSWLYKKAHAGRRWNELEYGITFALGPNASHWMFEDSKLTGIEFEALKAYARTIPKSEDVPIFQKACAKMVTVMSDGLFIHLELYQSFNASSGHIERCPPPTRPQKRRRLSGKLGVCGTAWQISAHEDQISRGGDQDGPMPTQNLQTPTLQTGGSYSEYPEINMALPAVGSDYSVAHLAFFDCTDPKATEFRESDTNMTSDRPEINMAFPAVGSDYSVAHLALLDCTDPKATEFRESDTNMTSDRPEINMALQAVGSDYSDYSVAHLALLDCTDPKATEFRESDTNMTSDRPEINMAFPAVGSDYSDYSVAHLALLDCTDPKATEFRESDTNMTSDRLEINMALQAVGSDYSVAHLALLDCTDPKATEFRESDTNMTSDRPEINMAFPAVGSDYSVAHLALLDCTDPKATEFRESDTNMTSDRPEINMALQAVGSDYSVAHLALLDCTDPKATEFRESDTNMTSDRPEINMALQAVGSDYSDYSVAHLALLDCIDPKTTEFQSGIEWNMENLERLMGLETPPNRGV